MKSFATRRRAVGVGGLLAVAAAAALAGGAGTGHAATVYDVQLSPLIGSRTSATRSGQVTYGGQIGYHLYVKNDGDSTTPHVLIVVTSDKATFKDTDNPNCAVNPADAHQLVCTPPGGTLTPNDDAFEANLRFTAPAGPASLTQVVTQAAVTVAAQTVGGKNTNGTTLALSDPRRRPRSSPA